MEITIDMLWRASTSSEPGTAHTLGPDAESSGERTGLLNLIDDLEPYGNFAIETGVFAVPVLTWKYRHVMSLIRGIQGFFHDAIRQSLEEVHNTPSSGSASSTIVHQLLKQGSTPKEAQGELQNIFFAAFDTTTALLTNLFDCVGRDHEVHRRLKDEISRVVSMEGGLTETSLAKLVFLRATIFETLRLHSPVTSHIRTARTETYLPRGGSEGDGRLFVPKGTSVIWSTYALNRRSQIYGDDCMDFRPERWLEGSSGGRNLNNASFMPFGSGPRNCLGQQFALLEVSYVAARVLMAADVVDLYEPHLEFQEAAAVTYYNGRGSRIRFYNK